MKKRMLIDFIKQKVWEYGHISFEPPCCQFYALYFGSVLDNEVLALNFDDELKLECLTIKELRQIAERIQRGN